jgi:glycosyltransferase involved in cell wall biosynthesis
MPNTPIVSCILPSYNHYDFVTSAVESVLNQSVKDLELIVVDDGSTDGTPEQIEKIKDPRLKLIRLVQNRIQHPRNLALSYAKGRYIAFQNSDDEWLPDKLEAQIEIFNQHDDVVACFTDVELIDDFGEVAKKSWLDGAFTTENRTSNAWLRHFFERGNCLCITSAIVNRDALTKAGNFRGSLIQLSDFDLWVRLAAIGNFHILKEKLTRMRIVSGKSLLEDPKLDIDIDIDTVENLSAPNESAINRHNIEFTDVLGNFIKSPILDLIPEIFNSHIPKSINSEIGWQVWLATYAWSLNTPAHNLFSDKVIAAILENENARNEATQIFGAEFIKEFIRMRGEIKIQISGE